MGTGGGAFGNRRGGRKATGSRCDDSRSPSCSTLEEESRDTPRERRGGGNKIGKRSRSPRSSRAGSPEAGDPAGTTGGGNEDESLEINEVNLVEAAATSSTDPRGSNEATGGGRVVQQPPPPPRATVGTTEILVQQPPPPPRAPVGTTETSGTTETRTLEVRACPYTDRRYREGTRVPSIPREPVAWQRAPIDLES